MDFRAKIREKFENNIFNAGRAPGTTTNCSEGYHRHSDKYNNKCHRIDQKHEGEGGTSHGESNKRTPSSENSEKSETRYVHTKEEK